MIFFPEMPQQPRPPIEAVQALRNQIKTVIPFRPPAHGGVLVDVVLTIASHEESKPHES